MFSFVLSTVLVSQAFTMTCEVYNESRYLPTPIDGWQPELLVEKEIDLSQSANGNKRLATLCVTTSVQGMLKTEVKIDVVDSVSNQKCENPKYELALDQNRVGLWLTTIQIINNQNVKTLNRTLVKLPFESQINTDVPDVNANFLKMRTAKLIIKCY